jgi:hypothetical protein
MHFLRYAMVACLAMVGFAAVPSVGHAEWVMLGEKHVGFGVDRDVIQVGRQEGRFERLMLRVQKNDIEMLDLKVIYANGEQDDIPVRHFIRQGGETRPLDLRGDHGRKIDRIEMTYRSRPDFRGQAVVQVYGDSVRGGFGRDEGRRDDRRDAREERREERREEHRERRNYDWELLGTRRVGVMLDRDVLDVGMKEGRFRKIKLRVRGNDVHFYDLKVVYGNGQADDIRVRENLREGSETRPLDLSGRDRFIRHIEMTYGRDINFRGKATIEVWGLQSDD